MAELDLAALRRQPRHRWNCARTTWEESVEFGSRRALGPEPECDCDWPAIMEALSALQRPGIVAGPLADHAGDVYTVVPVQLGKLRRMAAVVEAAREWSLCPMCDDTRAALRAALDAMGGSRR